MYIIVYFPLSYIYILCLMCWIMLDVAGGETTETGCIVTPLKVFCICFGGGLWLGRFTWCLSPSRVPAGMYLCQESPFISKAFISRWGNPSFQTTTIPVKGSLISNSPNQPYPTILWLSINKVNKVQLQITPGEKNQPSQRCMECRPKRAMKEATDCAWWGDADEIRNDENLAESWNVSTRFSCI